MLPRSMLEDLDFTYGMKSEAELADGSIVETTIYSGKIKWFGKRRTAQTTSRSPRGDNIVHGLLRPTWVTEYNYLR
ncbi:hypothetical protein LM603_06270 [Candidatus Acetothermia bacterium]|nr:hypothetical protein [Candidatus Acetothermia bacterium]